MHQAYGGVVPELASRDHVRRLLPLVREALADAHSEPRRPSTGWPIPRARASSARCWWGPGFARAWRYAWGRPAVGIHHLEGHLLAPLLEPEPPAFPFLALLVSGGHTQLVDVAGLGQYRILGETLDDAAGEAFDKTAKMLGLPYPGGAALAQLAESGRSGRFAFPRPMLDRPGPRFQFQWPEDRRPSSLAGPRLGRRDSSGRRARFPGSSGRHARGEVAAGAAWRPAIGAWWLPAASAPIGACASGCGRWRTRSGRELYFPRAEFCTDNGAMIALAGCLRLAAGARQGLAARRPGELGARGTSGQQGLLKSSMDKIFIHALKTEAIIGIFDWERQVRQTVIVDIEIGADIRKAALTDSIDDTLNYKRVAKRVLAFVEASQFHLVETLAEHLAMLILEEFGVAWVRIVLSKPGADPQLAGRRRRARARSQPSRAVARAARAARLRAASDPCRAEICLDRPLTWRQVGADRRRRARSRCRRRRAAAIAAARRAGAIDRRAGRARLRREHRRRRALRRHRDRRQTASSCRATSS